MQLIPKIIHQTWKDEFPPEHIFLPAWIKSWKKMHPDWQYVLWTDAQNREFIGTHYDWFLPVFDAYDAGIKRADAVRYFLLYHYGGLYVDLDFQALRNVEPLLNDQRLVFGSVNENQNDKDSIPNAFMASIPGHPFWKIMFNVLQKNANIKRTENATGPAALKQALKKFGHKDEIKIWDSKYIYPLNWRKMSMYKNSVPQKVIETPASCYPDAYAITFWQHCWEPKKFSLKQTLKKMIPFAWTAGRAA